MNSVNLMIANGMLLAEAAPAAKLALPLLMGFAVGWVAWSVCRILFAPRTTANLGIYETERRERLRDENPVYRWFEPLIDELSVSQPAANQTQQKIALALRMLPDWPPWTPQDFAATKKVEAGLTGLVVGLLLWPIMGPIVAAVGAVIVASSYIMFWGVRVQELAQKRRMVFLKRLPYAVDLLALMMEAGASFDEAVATLVDESPGHPIGQEFGYLLREIRLGRSRRDALIQLRDRMEDDNVREFVTAILNGEEFGTPLSRILRTQADQMRLKRSQWAEKAAGEAQVKIVFPGIMIMIACLLIIVTPFIVKFLDVFI
ncbi:MAG: type II secretion system F family protein [Planctomycetales bacterium]